eukprot:CAMPEP_0172532530 /NCGR_PEP_ID=MMETSP1067-20121228/5551_1 /TAXON_ID=265564 ORGANISM="Thalassiosira punctigera, Strain Tpunct2005C2" /NCGR_SAMPLE_ID=MMETSP1067 /ASSEMBLY_ACC=CAM_ASM_000444 /LENGTH=73 /DNA_ID=CAMNT_0013317061 /DNA_START=240 /DNA_END=461 /DNA_ORIENTATION=+
MTETRFDVGMTCEGCASAVKRILSKLDGVTNIDTNVEAKTVVVTHGDAATKEVMLAKLTKWSEASGKSVALAA